MRIFIPSRTRPWTWLALLLVSLLPGVARAAQHTAAQAAASPADSAVKNKTEGEAYLAANQANEGVVTLESGLQYKILKTGTGKTPTTDDSVTVRFRGTHTDGTEFASTDAAKRTPIVAIRKAIKGWSEALQMMPVGSKWQLFIPANLAYGARGVSGRVGPHAVVIFEVELLSITAAANTALASRGNDAAAALNAIRVSFKLDSRLTKGTYLGDRWVSPPKFMSMAQVGKSITVEARAHGVDARGRAKAIRPTWEPADPEMVTVTLGGGNAATITVQRPGESSLRVTSDGVSSQLTINAAYQNDVLQVNISQK